MNLKKGSYTVEAAIFVSMLILIFMIAMKFAIGLYQEVCAGQPEYFQENLWVVDTFYEQEITGGLLNGEN
jgi:hypothetical protein